MSTFSLLSAARRTISIALYFPLDPDMSSSKPSLADLRRRIDEVDDQIHDLLMRRAEIVEAIGERKKDGQVPAFQPGREAVILRRLMARHSGRFPRAALVRMWREMLAATVGLQRNLTIAVYAPSADSGYWDLARDHFGSNTPMTPYRSVGEVIRAVTDAQASIAVVPMPSEDDPDPWWPFIASASGPAPQVLARLPFAGRGNARAGGDALAIGSGVLEPTGDDRSLVVVETRGEVGRARLIAGFAAAGLAGTFRAAFVPGRGTTLNLVELADFVLPDDRRLTIFREHVGEAVERIALLGSYGMPLALDPQSTNLAPATAAQRKAQA